MGMSLTSCIDLWRKISIYVAIPALLIASVNAWNLYSAHQEHLAHAAAHDTEVCPDNRLDQPWAAC